MLPGVERHDVSRALFRVEQRVDLTDAHRSVTTQFVTFNVYFTILNAEFIVLDAEFIVLDAEFIVLDAEFIVFEWKFRPSRRRLHRSA